jgi:hypothetical protein
MGHKPQHEHFFDFVVNGYNQAKFLAGNVEDDHAVSVWQQKFREKPGFVV